MDGVVYLFAGADFWLVVEKGSKCYYTLKNGI